MKFCNKCEQEKHVGEFTRNPSASDGLFRICKVCRRKTESDQEKARTKKIRAQIDKRRERLLAAQMAAQRCVQEPAFA